MHSIKMRNANLMATAPVMQEPLNWRNCYHAEIWKRSRIVHCFKDKFSWIWTLYQFNFPPFPDKHNFKIVMIDHIRNFPNKRP